MNGGSNTIFLTNKNVFGLEGEAICQLVFFFFCIASRQAKLALSLTKIWVSLWLRRWYIIFLHAFHLSQSLLRISSSAKVAFCRHQFGVFHFCWFVLVCMKEKRGFVSYCIYVKH